MKVNTSEPRRGVAWLWAVIGLIAVCTAALLVPLVRHLPLRPSAPVEIRIPALAQEQAPTPPSGSAAPSTGAVSKILVPAPLDGRIARLVANALPSMHLTRAPLDDTVATNAFILYINNLDFDHSIFLQADIDRFQLQAPQLNNRLRNGDVAFAFEIFECYRERLRNRLAFVKKRLDQEIDLNQTDEYVWKRKAAPWPQSNAEWNEIWDKKIRNEYLTRVVARQLASEKSTSSNRPTETPSVLTNGLQRITDQENALLAPTEFIRKRYDHYREVIEDTDPEWVLQTYLSAFFHAYDPHSDYLSVSSTEDFDIGMKLSLVGIGAILSSEDGAAKIERLIPGGPADRDGRLKPGDKIIAVAQGTNEPVDVLHWPLSKTVRLIRGEKGTPVSLTILPAADAGGALTTTLKIIRDEVQLEEQAAKGRIEKVTHDGHARSVGVIVLPTFYVDLKNKLSAGESFRSSTRDVAQIVSDMKTGGVEGIILDLRNNGGGSLAEAVEMTGLFLLAGPIVQVKEIRGTQALSDPDPGVLWNGRLIVLVNRQSASASEILAAALQDYGRALIVGDSKTHGKGSVQSLVNLDQRDPRLGSVKLTTASFHRITGYSTQCHGVTPDIQVSSLLDALEVGEEFLPHALTATQIPPLLFRSSNQVAGIIPTLRARSETRQQSSPAFKNNRELMAKIAEQQAAQSISLNYTKRLALARTETDLQQLQDDIEAEAEDSKSPPKGDIVLPETLSILSDWIGLKAESAR
jgi:carboxyl-terminal processing protease